MEGKRDGNSSSESPVHGTAMDSQTERKRESVMRGTECVKRPRSVLWGERLGNDLSYPAALFPHPPQPHPILAAVRLFEAANVVEFAQGIEKAFQLDRLVGLVGIQPNVDVRAGQQDGFQLFEVLVGIPSDLDLKTPAGRPSADLLSHGAWRIDADGVPQLDVLPQLAPEKLMYRNARDLSREVEERDLAGALGARRTVAHSRPDRLDHLFLESIRFERCLVERERREVVAKRSDNRFESLVGPLRDRIGHAPTNMTVFGLRADPDVVAGLADTADCADTDPERGTDGNTHREYVHLADAPAGPHFVGMSQRSAGSDAATPAREQLRELTTVRSHGGS